MPLPLIIPLVVAGAGVYAGKKLDDVSIFGYKPFDDDTAPAGNQGQFQTRFSDVSTLKKVLLYGAAGYASYRVIKKVTK